MFLLLPIGAAAQTAPLLEAKGDTAQCESFNAWIAKAQELGGEDVTGGTIESQHFVARIPPAFADSVFEPMIGKPYRELTSKDKKNILKILKRCMGRAGQYTFLTYAFDTSPATNNSTRRDLLAAIENVPEPDVDRAQQSADARAAKAEALAVNRPMRVARMFPGNPAAVRRSDVRNAECYGTLSRHVVVYNEYVYDGREVIPQRSDTTGRGAPCDSAHVRELFIDGLRSLLLVQQDGMDLFSIGDICGPDPAILYVRKALATELFGEVPELALDLGADLLCPVEFIEAQLATELPVYGSPPPNPAPPGSAHFSDFPYKFYVPSGTDGTIDERIISPVEFGMLVTRDVIKAQCAGMPEKVAVYAGTIDKNPGGRRRAGLQPPPPENLEVWQYYSGSFNPQRLEDRLRHDDTKLAQTYVAFANARLEYQKAAPERKAKADDARAMGALWVVMGILFIQHYNDPCNNPMVSDFTKEIELRCPRDFDQEK